jgi:hypothetical protein
MMYHYLCTEIDEQRWWWAGGGLMVRELYQAKKYRSWKLANLACDRIKSAEFKFMSEEDIANEKNNQ